MVRSGTRGDRKLLLRHTPMRALVTSGVPGSALRNSAVSFSLYRTEGDGGASTSSCVLPHEERMDARRRMYQIRVNEFDTDELSLPRFSVTSSFFLQRRTRHAGSATTASAGRRRGRFSRIASRRTHFLLSNGIGTPARGHRLNATNPSSTPRPLARLGSS